MSADRIRLEMLFLPMYLRHWQGWEFKWEISDVCITHFTNSFLPKGGITTTTTKTLTHFQVNLKAGFGGWIFTYFSLKTDTIYLIDICAYALRFSFLQILVYSISYTFLFPFIGIGRRVGEINTPQLINWLNIPLFLCRGKLLPFVFFQFSEFTSSYCISCFRQHVLLSNSLL